MRQLVYDVAISADGFITGPGEGLDGFTFEGDHVDAYQARLARYETVVMGRRTYTIGYEMGMRPGDKPYAPMDHHVFSRTLELPADCGIEVVRDDWLGAIDRLKAGSGGDIYLCGGGAFAGFLMRGRRVDRLVLKVNPFLAGGGTPLFAGLESPQPLRRLGSTPHASGVMLLEYAVGE